MKIKQKIDYINKIERISLLDALPKMDNYVADIISKQANAKIWFLEHDPIYTAGTNAKPEELLNKMFEVVNVGRGGKYTYHGPGQLIAYIMLDLKKMFSPSQPDLHKYIYYIEQWIINSLYRVGIKAIRRKNRIGVWVDNNGKDEKICAIGIRVKKWISYHGIALNINPNLKHYQGINPCGLGEYGISAVNNYQQEITMQAMSDIMEQEFKRMFT